MAAASASDVLRVSAASVVGRARELELVVAALHGGRHILLEGPPGTGKSTLLRSVAEALGVGFAFVEGNAELTPARLVGHFDPARVLTDGYSADVFVDGPLVSALRDGSLLYVEEINRIPEETLNVLITVMSEGEITVPRLGTVKSAAGFRLVAAMNPFDAVGTARISSAVYDRVCRVAMTYQSAADEVEIVVRPQHIKIDFDRGGRGPLPTVQDGVAARGEVVRARFMGSESLVEVRMDHDGSVLKATVPNVFLPKPGRPLWLMIRRERCFVFPRRD